MKKPLLLSILFWAFAAAPPLITAQVTSGSWLLSGNSSSSIDFELGSNFSHFSFGEAYYHPSSRIGVGGLAYWSLFAYDDLEVDFGLAPGVRYYFSPEKRTVPIVLANAGFLKLGDQLSFLGRLGAGVNHFIKPDIAIEGTAGYLMILGEEDYSFHNLSLEASIKAWLNPSGSENGEKQDFIVPLAKGTWVIGTNFNGFGGNSFVFSLFPEENQVALAFAPDIGYFLSRRWMLGADLSWTLNFDEGSRSGLFVGSPYTRYYLSKGVGRLQWFGEGALEYRRNTYHNTEREDFETVVTHSFDVGLGAGASFFLSPSFALEGKLRYRLGANNLALNAGFLIFLGGMQ